jgi:transposase
MLLIQLSSYARKVLRRVVHSHSDARLIRRAQVLLGLDAHEDVSQLAKRVGRSRQTLYAIVRRYKERHALPVIDRLRDQPRAGRPGTKRARSLSVIRDLLARPPADYHYRSAVWTVPLLRRQVQRRLKCSVSARTIRRALHQLRHRFKRPRYVYAPRPVHWQQVKGG